VATRLSNKLVATQVASLGPGKHADGDGLYLYVDAKRRFWVFRYFLAGKRREMGLGAAGDRPKVTLARARQKAADARAKVEAGIDPMRAKITEVSSTPTFGQMADKLIEAKGVVWKNDKHRAQWVMTLRDYASKLRPVPINEVTTAHVFDTLQPIWNEKPETASRLRGRIEATLDFAKSLGHRTGENPAAWKNNLQALLGSPKKLVKARSRTADGHHLALPYADVPALVTALQAKETVSARALEFLILTAGRTSEVLNATWGEIDISSATWNVPAGRMKTGVDHRVPLCPRAVKILEGIASLAGEEGPEPIDPIFPSARRSFLSNMALLQLLRGMKAPTTAHGLRSSFRDWAGDCTHFPREVIEQCLSHAIGNKAEAAYRRSDALERRREVMKAWDEFVTGGAK